MPTLAALLRTPYHAAFRAFLPLRCALADLRAGPGDTLPPASLRFRVSEALSVPEFLKVGERCAIIIDAAIAARGLQPRRILDFGCGCGRTLRWMLERDSGTEFHGVDVDAEAIRWSTAHYPQAKFALNGPEPPLAFDDGFFDAIYCISVFTHLDEPMQDNWLDELHRVLRPGGLLLLTVHGAVAAAQLKPGIAIELAEKGFVHKRSRKLHGILPEWYHTTLHTPAYIEQRLSIRGFEDVRYEVIAGGIQDLVTANKAQ